MSEIVRQIPVRVILNESTALIGAARAAAIDASMLKIKGCAQSVRVIQMRANHRGRDRSRRQRARRANPQHMKQKNR